MLPAKQGQKSRDDERLPQALQPCRESVLGPAAVRAVQDQVDFRNLRNGHTLNVDGIDGPKTIAAVKAFQQAISHEVHGLLVDGIAGQALVTEALPGRTP